MSWLLSPSSAMKMMPKLSRNAFMGFLRVASGGRWDTIDRTSDDVWPKVLLTHDDGPGDRGSSPSVSISQRRATPLRRTGHYLRSRSRCPLDSESRANCRLSQMESEPPVT